MSDLPRMPDTPVSARILQSTPAALIYGHASASAQRHDALRAAGAEVVDAAAIGNASAGNASIDLAWLLSDLARRGVNELHVEAGAVLSGALMAAGWVDELLIYQHACLLGTSARPMFDLPSPQQMQDRQEWRLLETRSFGEDWRLRLRPEARA